jgi:A/G-specific adenine glycosylase
LVAEVMAQQTQISRVVEYFTRFVGAGGRVRGEVGGGGLFPTVRALAEADEAQVLAAWSGLGYYRRARHLHAAAKQIVERHGGEVPPEVEALRALSGIGRYTAGAIASIVFGRPEPIVDGNVRRVLLRLEARRLSGAKAEAWAWSRAGALVARAAEQGPETIARFNEGLMELGATICVPAPATPRCEVCPLRELCKAWGEGLQGKIPAPKAGAKATRKSLYCSTLRLAMTDEAGERRWLMVQRTPGTIAGETGAMWSGLWQAPTIERLDRWLTGRELLATLGLPAAVRLERRPVTFDHTTTHRDVKFKVWSGAIVGAIPEAEALVDGARWIGEQELGTLGLSSAQRRILIDAGARSIGNGKDKGPSKAKSKNSSKA